jgi:hypothetical protein
MAHFSSRSPPRRLGHHVGWVYDPGSLSNVSWRALHDFLSYPGSPGGAGQTPRLLNIEIVLGRDIFTSTNMTSGMLSSAAPQRYVTTKTLRLLEDVPTIRRYVPVATMMNIYILYNIYAYTC